MARRIFVTGGTGFLGSHFIRAALEKGHSVLALRRPGSRPRLHLASEPRWLEGSLSDAWNDTLRDCDSLVHFAAVGVSPQKATWSDLLQTNVLDRLHLWRIAADSGIRRMVICGSCFEYGSSVLFAKSHHGNFPLPQTQPPSNKMKVGNARVPGTVPSDFQPQTSTRYPTNAAHR